MAKDSFQVRKLLNIRPMSSDPSSPSNGDVWYNSTANELRAFVDGEIITLGSGGGWARHFMDVH